MNTGKALVSWVLLLLTGCADEMRATKSAMPESAAARAPAGGEAARVDMADRSDSMAGEAAPQIPRKIIYTANIDLVVEDLDRVEPEVPRLVASFGGYISKQDLSGAVGAYRRASWTARVPVDKFDAFVAAVTALGETQRKTLDTQDVTEKYFDTEARLNNKRVEESRLIKLLEERTGKLEEVLSVEKELTRVRGEIEQLEGSLRLLTNLTSLSTITINATQRLADYKPPESPLFSTLIGRTFWDSVNALVRLGKALILVVVAIVPWLPLLIALALLLRFILRAMAPSRPPLAPPGEAFLPRP
jgi:hypothetical protein